jgi:hypothetical protein
MELEYLCMGPKGFQTESGADAGFGSARDKEFNEGNLVKVTGNNGEKCRCWFFILTLVEGINHNEGCDFCLSEWTNNKFLHLRVKSFPSDIRVSLQDREQPLSEGWISAGELEGEGGEDSVKVAPFIVIPGAEETGTERPIREGHLRECLSNSGLPRPSETVEPEDAFVLVVVQPVLELQQHIFPGPLHTSLSIPTEVSGIRCRMHTVEEVEVRYFLFTGYRMPKPIKEWDSR